MYADTVPEPLPLPAQTPSDVRTFLIADVRGYTRFTAPLRALLEWLWRGRGIYLYVSP
jgi:hypothetical protein